MRGVRKADRWSRRPPRRSRAARRYPRRREGSAGGRWSSCSQVYRKGRRSWFTPLQIDSLYIVRFSRARSKWQKPGRMSSACDKIARDIYHDRLMRFAMPRLKRAPKPDNAWRLGEFLCFAVYSASHAFNRVYKPLLDELGLTYPQYLVMVLLWEQDDQTVGSLGEKLFLESSTLTPLLKRLEALGQVKRTRDRVDERQVRVRLTDKGRAMREKAREIPDCILAASGLEIDELRRLQGELVALRTALERYHRD